MSDHPEFDLIVHHNDLDGHAAAWVIWMSGGKDYNPILRSVDYGDAPPDLYRRRTAIVDFCFGIDVMTKLAEVAPKLLVLDHHKTTRDRYLDAEEWPEWLQVDVTRAGCRMAWDYFQPGREPPPLIKFAEDHDLWRFDHPGTREYCAALEAYREYGGWSMHALESVHRRPFEQIIAEGRPLIAMQERQVEAAAARARLVTLPLPALPDEEGAPPPIQALLVNSTIYPSQVGEALLQQDGAPDIAIVWWENKRGLRYSFRSIDTDVSQIAKRFGGGGHPGAAAVQCQTPLPFEYAYKS